MIRLLWYFFLFILLAIGMTWLADRPGQVTLEWQGYEISTSFLVVTLGLLASFGLLLILVMGLSKLWQSPQKLSGYWQTRRERNAFEALSKGIIAAGAGDVQSAEKQIALLQKYKPRHKTQQHSALLKLLTAQTAQLNGDQATLQQTFRSMEQDPATKLLGLRGLYATAASQHNHGASLNYAAQAYAINPEVSWAGQALLSGHVLQQNWKQALAILHNMPLPLNELQWKKAALTLMEAYHEQPQNPDKALSLAQKAYALDASLVPAVVLQISIVEKRGLNRKAVKLWKSAWQQIPHPELAHAFLEITQGQSPTQQFEELRKLTPKPYQLEQALALSQAALKDQRYEQAADFLAPYFALETKEQRLCLLMQKITKAQGNDTEAEKWLNAALTASPDSCWMADGQPCATWQATSPRNGELVSCLWQQPYGPSPKRAVGGERAVAHKPALAAPTDQKSVTTTPLSRNWHNNSDKGLMQQPDDPGLNLDKNN